MSKTEDKKFFYLILKAALMLKAAHDEKSEWFLIRKMNVFFEF